MVGQHHVAAPQPVRMVLGEALLQRGLHQPELRRDHLGVGDQPSRGVEDAAREVEHLADDRRVGRAVLDDRHLLGDRRERAVQDLLRDRVDRHPRSSSSVPPGAPRSVQPGGTVTVESSCSTIAGPAMMRPLVQRHAVVHGVADAVHRRGCRRARARPGASVTGGAVERDGGPAADGHDLGRRARRGVAVRAAVRGVEPAHRPGQGGVGDRAARPAAPSARRPGRGSARRSTSAAATARPASSGATSSVSAASTASSAGASSAPAGSTKPRARSWRTSAPSRPSAAVMPGQRGITMRVDAELVGDLRRVHGPGAAERDQAEPPRVVAAGDRDHAQRRGHVGAAARGRRPPRRPRPTGRAARATDRSTAARASAPSSGARPPRNRAGSSVPSTTWASVTVASSPPMPYAAGPGSAPADSGPTVSAPNRSTRAIEPPPAPIEPTSTCGSATGMAGHRSAVAQLRLAADHQRDVGRGAADVDRERVGDAGQARHARGAEHARRGAGRDQPDRQRGRVGGPGDAAGRAHQVQRRVDAGRLQPRRRGRARSRRPAAAARR